MEQVFGNIREFRAGGTALLMVAQNAMAALRLCDRADLLETGQVTRSGSGTELLASPDARNAHLGRALA